MNIKLSDESILRILQDAQAHIDVYRIGLCALINYYLPGKCFVTPSRVIPEFVPETFRDLIESRSEENSSFSLSEILRAPTLCYWFGSPSTQEGIELRKKALKRLISIYEEKCKHT